MPGRFNLTHAFLSVMTATEPAPADEKNLISLTRNEIRHLLTQAITTLQALGHTLRWSFWRRRHQAHARAYHYKKQDQLDE